MNKFIITLFCLGVSISRGGETIKFEKVEIDGASHNNEACAFGDFTGNGKLDFACADAWFEYPDWTPHPFPDNPADDFMASMDVDGDGYWDVIRGAFGNNGWYQNNQDGTFSARKNINFGGVHSGGLWDVDGDGEKRELVSANANETIRWAEYVNGNWVTHVVSDAISNWGSGAGDVNGDGRPDIVRPDAWFEAPADPRSGNWTRHQIAIGAMEEKPVNSVKNIKVDHPVWEWNNDVGVYGHTVQIYVYDVDGDELNDLISSSGHRMGIMWNRQIRNGDNISFEPHVIDGSVSEVHSLELEDMDNDGDLDVIASKRWRGHGAYEDPLSEDPLFISWYEHIQVRPYFKRHWITRGEGISSGTKLGIGDFDGDNDLDVVAIAKNQDGRGGGPWLFINMYPETVEVPDEGLLPDDGWLSQKLGDETNVTVAWADIDKDNILDLVGGNFWYKGPDFTPRAFRTLGADGLSEVLDVDGDGWLDVISGSFAEGLSWYKNPQGGTGNWTKAVIDSEGNYENGNLWDVDGDGVAAEIVSSSYIAGVKWWEVVNGNWVSHTISDMQCNFGAGVGDVNGDGRPDIIRPNAWFEAPADPRSGTWTPHNIALGAADDSQTSPGADMTAPMWLGRVQVNGRQWTHGHTGQIHVYDVDDDGKNDIIASSAHRVGIFWYKQIDINTFERKTVDASWSQAHALEFVDMDDDGDPDLLTGKALNAQPTDPQVSNPLQVVWYELNPAGPIYWLKHELTYGQGIGAGYNIATADYDGDGDLDVAVTGSNGGPWILNNQRIGGTFVKGQDKVRGLDAAVRVAPGARGMQFRDGESWKNVKGQSMGVKR